MNFADPSSSRLGKARKIALPPEHILSEFVANVTNPHESWTSHTPACSWFGLTCDSSGHVTEINWRNLNVGGPLQWAFLVFSLQKIELTKFAALKNRFYGPLSLSQLPPTLRYLSVYGNAFTGSIDLTNLPKTMEYLSVGDNALSGSIDLSCLPSTLRSLDLSYNIDLGGDINHKELPASLTELETEGTNIDAEKKGITPWDSFDKKDLENRMKMPGIDEMFGLFDEITFSFRSQFCKGKVYCRLDGCEIKSIFCMNIDINE